MKINKEITIHETVNDKYSMEMAIREEYETAEYVKYEELGEFNSAAEAVAYINREHPATKYRFCDFMRKLDERWDEKYGFFGPA